MDSEQTSVDQQAAVKAAEDLIKRTAETTATALNIQYIQRDIVDIKQAQKDTSTKMESALKSIADRDDSYVKKEDFVFWRNILVGSMLVTVFMSIVITSLQKVIK